MYVLTTYANSILIQWVILNQKCAKNIGDFQSQTYNFVNFQTNFDDFWKSKALHATEFGKIIKIGQIQSLKLPILIDCNFFKIQNCPQFNMDLSYIFQLTRFLPFLSSAPVFESSDNSNQSLILLWWSANRFIAFFDTPSNWAKKKIQKN